MAILLEETQTLLHTWKSILLKQVKLQERMMLDQCTVSIRVLASANEDVVNRSIEEFEIAQMWVLWLGSRKQFQDQINKPRSANKVPSYTSSSQDYPKKREIALQSRTKKWRGVSTKRSNYQKDVRTCFGYTPIGLKLVNTFNPNDDRFKSIVDSWRGIRPVIPLFSK